MMLRVECQEVISKKGGRICHGRQDILCQMPLHMKTSQPSEQRMVPSRSEHGCCAKRMGTTYVQCDTQQVTASASSIATAAEAASCIGQWSAGKVLLQDHATNVQDEPRKLHKRLGNAGRG